MNKVEFLQSMLMDETFKTIKCFHDKGVDENKFNDSFRDMLSISIMLYENNNIRFDFMNDIGPWTPQCNEIINKHDDILRALHKIYDYTSASIKFGSHTAVSNCPEKNTNLDYIEMNISKILYILHIEKIDIDYELVYRKIHDVEKLCAVSIESGCLIL